LILPTRPVSAQSFQYDALVFHAPGFEFTPSQIVEEYNGPTPADLGLASDKFIMTNEKENRVTIGGVTDHNLLIDSIVYLASKAAAAKGSLLISSDSVISKDGRVTLIINTSADDVANVRRAALSSTKSDLTLYGAQHNLLSKNGLSRVWGGVRTTVSSDALSKLTLKQGDLVERLDGGKRVTVTSNTSAQANLVKQPSNIVFLINDTSSSNGVPEIGKINASTAQALYASGLTGVDNGKSVYSSTNFPTSSSTAQQLFSELTSGVQFYVVNGSSQNASKAIERVTSGADLKQVSSIDQQIQQLVSRK
jgi:hypothetical protein